MADMEAAGSNTAGFQITSAMPASGYNQVANTDFDVPINGGISENWVIIGPVDQPSGNSTVVGNLTVFNQLNIEGQFDITGNVDIR